MKKRNNKKRHFFRKFIAIFLTVLAFTSSASFSRTATATVMDTDVIFVNDSGSRIAVDKSDIIRNEVSMDGIENAAYDLADEELDKIAAESKKAADDFNKRNNETGDTSHDVTIIDKNGDKKVPGFEDDWSLMLINKDHLIPYDYTFELATISGSVKVDVRVAEHLVDMIKDARTQGVGLYVASPYRDMERQTYVFNRKVRSYIDQGYDYDKAYDLASETVAIPGTSEHQVGLAVDIISSGYRDLDAGFANTEGGRWLAENAPEYGFILRYPRGKEDITGIEFEPWHYRYVGVEAAKEMTQLGLTLEEYDEMIGLVDSDE